MYDETQIVVSIDPGETSGAVSALVTLTPDGNGKGDIEVKVQEALEFSWNDWVTLKKLLLSKPPELLVIEDFRLAAGRAMHLVNSQFLTIRVIGAIQYAIATSDLDPKPKMVLSPPGAMQLYPDDRLKTLGWYHRSKHVRAAMKHLLACCLRGRKCSFRKAG